MDAPSLPKESDIRAFLVRERLGYQAIELPHGLSTPGHNRKQAKEIAFSGSLQGKSVLDVGCYFGAFCIEALRRGAAHAVGLELNRDRIGIAREIAGFWGLTPDYIRADVEDRPDLGRFDIVLCLNVLHHVRDVIGTLRYLALCTRERLLIEAEPPSAKKHSLAGSVLAGKRMPFLGLRLPLRSAPSPEEVLNINPVIYTASCVPSDFQTFYFTPSALTHILDGHMRLFQSINKVESEFKGRYLLDCTRLQIDRMVVIAGVGRRSVSTLCQRIRRNDYADQLGIADMSDAHPVEAKRTWPVPLSQCFPKARYERVLYSYDLSLIDRRRLHSFRRDPACDLLLCAQQLDVVIVTPSVERLKQQLGESERAGEKNLLKLLFQPSYLSDLYGEWIAFSSSLDSRFFLYVERDGREVMYPCKSKDEALLEISRLYRG